MGKRKWALTSRLDALQVVTETTLFQQSISPVMTTKHTTTSKIYTQNTNPKPKNYEKQAKNTKLANSSLVRKLKILLDTVQQTNDSDQLSPKKSSPLRCFLLL